MFDFLGTIAEYFLDVNRKRTLEGLKAAAARGRKGDTVGHSPRWGVEPWKRGRAPW